MTALDAFGTISSRSYTGRLRWFGDLLQQEVEIIIQTGSSTTRQQEWETVPQELGPLRFEP